MQAAKFNLADKFKITENVFNENKNEKDWSKSTVHNAVADKLRVGLELMLF